jgi:hypothetical protein
MISKEGRELARQRAEALTKVYLTRREDLVVSEFGREAGVDFLVTLKNGDAPTMRQFGVAVKSAEYPDRPETFLFSAEERYEDAPYPVCLFVFGAEGGEPLWKWLKAADGTDTELQPLTNEAIAHIVGVVEDWYEARRGNL